MKCQTMDWFRLMVQCIALWDRFLLLWGHTLFCSSSILCWIWRKCKSRLLVLLKSLFTVIDNLTLWQIFIFYRGLSKSNMTSTLNTIWEAKFYLEFCPVGTTRIPFSCYLVILNIWPSPHSTPPPHAPK